MVIWVCCIGQRWEKRATPRNQLKTCLRTPTHIKDIKKISEEKRQCSPRLLEEITTLSDIPLQLDMASFRSKSISG